MVQKFLVLLVIAAIIVVIEGNGMEVILTKVPTGCESAEKVAIGDKILVDYVGTIDSSSASGTLNAEFDNSYTRGVPFEFIVGRGQVTLGLDAGVLGMCVGENRTLIIPPELAFGANGFGDSIPANATLNYDISCVKFDKPMGTQPNVFSQMDTNKDGSISFAEFSAWFTLPKNGGAIPNGLWESEDKDNDKSISWDEFSGPKGDYITKYSATIGQVSIESSLQELQDHSESSAHNIADITGKIHKKLANLKSENNNALAGDVQTAALSRGRAPGLPNGQFFDATTGLPRQAAPNPADIKMGRFGDIGSRRIPGHDDPRVMSGHNDPRVMPGNAEPRVVPRNPESRVIPEPKLGPRKNIL